MTRHIAFEGIGNFRDFGDYVAGERRLKPGLLYRSAHHANATDADLAALAGLGLSVIVDLRRPNERERDPSRRWEGFAATVVESDAGHQATDEWHAFLAASDLSESSFRDYLTTYYRHAPTVPRHVELFSRYFRALAESEGPVLVHCAAGKDRTGVICALTHHLAGVHEDDIVADYLLTNDPVRMAERMPLVLQMIRETTGRTATEAAARVAMGVDAAYLAEAFAAMRREFGSVDGYLEAALGLDAALRARIHERLLA
ncbi:MAG: tyrosine-protein phosphatase [Phenylobacterium sp.]